MSRINIAIRFKDEHGRELASMTSDGNVPFCPPLPPIGSNVNLEEDIYTIRGIVKSIDMFFSKFYTIYTINLESTQRN